MSERHRLFLLAAPFDDGPDGPWYCHDCAAMEGALAANPHWSYAVDVRRVGWRRPRTDVVAELGEDAQGLPALILRDGADAPEAKTANGRRYLDDPKAIGRYLKRAYGGAGPHP